MLTDIQCKTAKPKGRPYKLTHGHGFYLLVAPSGRKSFRWNFLFDGKQKTLTYGNYPEVTLKAALSAWTKELALLLQGTDPAEHRKYFKDGDRPTFELVASEWFSKKSPIWSKSHQDRTLGSLKKNLFPFIEQKPIDGITGPDLLRVLRRIEANGYIETANRARSIASLVFRYGLATGRCDRDPAGDLRGALAVPVVQHMAAITDPAGIGGLLRAIDGYQGQFVTHCALRLAPLLFVRPGELRGAEWSEIDVDKAEWRIPAEKMKARSPHIVPLSKQALKIIEDLRPLTGRGRYLFPSVRTDTRPMSENTILAALRRMGYGKGEMSGHGFRALASTTLHELGWPPDVIELQLAHRVGSSVAQAYNHSQRLDERRKMMQAWSDHLEVLMSGGEVIPIRRSLGG